MLFSSITFIYFYLPTVLAVYFLLPVRYRNGLLLAASFLFYAWGEPNYLVIMLLTIFINYFAAIFVSNQKTKTGKLLVLWLSIIVDLSMLGYFKYFNFFVENINLLFKGNIDFIKVVMPIGISFYTFQALSYVIDVYKGEVKAQKNIATVALYIALFPQLIAGPIVKYHDIENQLTSHDVTPDMFYQGLCRFIVGLGKKVLIANNMGLVADKVFNLSANDVSTPMAWLGALCYSMQIFYDFSGYSDMAIGLGQMFGFKFLENFNYPYISDSITEFWRRWHISLSSWLKNYVYIPLGGNRHGLTKTCINLMIVFAITGFWHGAQWTFILWGMWHGVFIVIEKLTHFPKLKGNLVLMTGKHLLTLFIVLIGWVLFRAEQFDVAYDYLKNMFGLIEHSDSMYGNQYFYDNIQLIALFFAIVFTMPWLRTLCNKLQGNIAFTTVYNLALIGIFLLCSIFLTASTYNPFIYFRF